MMNLPKKNSENLKDGVRKMIELLAKGYISQGLFEWVKKSGFMTAPASRKHHGACIGGLYMHSVAVAETLVGYTKDLRLEWQTERSPYVVGMFHDLCKVDQYVRTDYGYEHDENILLKGHGEKSVMLLSQFMTLTEEEIMCIRYHMGAYETENWKQFDLAIKKYPNVLYTHTADMYASKLMV